MRVPLGIDAQVDAHGVGALLVLADVLEVELSRPSRGSCFFACSE